MQRWRVTSGALVLAACAMFAAGCASSRGAQVESRLLKLEQARARLEMRLDEVTRNEVQLREGLAVQEASRKQMAKELSDIKSAQAASLEPPLTVVKVEPLPQPAAVTPAPPAPRVPASKLTPAAPAPAGHAPAASDEAEETSEQEPADLYRRAFRAFGDGRFGEAILDFEDFLRRYPNNEHADNAQYWIGESYFSQEQFRQAVVEFSRLLDRYPRGDKVPDALLKIGQSYENLGEAEKARVFWNRLETTFSGSEAAEQARKHLHEQARRSP